MSSQRPAPNAKPTQIKPPTPPKPYKFSKAARDLSPKVFWLHGDPTKTIPDTGEIDYVSEGQFACLCKPMSMYNTIKYEDLYGETTDATIGRVHWLLMLQYELQVASNAQDNERLKEISASLERVETPQGRYQVTPFGLSPGLSQDMARVVGFIFSVGGRVVKQLPDGEYVTDMVTADTVLQNLAPNAFMESLDEEGDKFLWYTILEVSHLWADQEAAESTSKVDPEANKDDDQGNLPESNSEEEPETPKRRARTSKS